MPPPEIVSPVFAYVSPRVPTGRPGPRLRREFLSVVAGRAGSAAIREAIATLDSVFAPLSSSEELVVARAAVDAGLLARAAAGFARAGNKALGASEDRFAYGNVLTRLNRNAEAAAQFKLVRTPRSLAALAAYQGARAWVRDGQIERGRAALVTVTRQYERDTVAAASAFFLRADLASDDRGDLEARRLHRIVATRYPSSRFAPDIPLSGRHDCAPERRPEAGGRGVRCLGRTLPFQ